MVFTPQFALAAFFLLVLSGPVVRADAVANAQAAILVRIKPPQFAERDFPITDFGAVADGDCTQALAQAIAACHAAGGGRVVVPAGLWLTGAVQLKSNVNLHLAAGARPPMS